MVNIYWALITPHVSVHYLILSSWQLTRKELIFLIKFFMKGNWSLMRLSSFPKVTHLIGGKTGIWTQICPSSKQPYFITILYAWSAIEFATKLLLVTIDVQQIESLFQSNGNLFTYLFIHYIYWVCWEQELNPSYLISPPPKPQTMIYLQHVCVHQMFIEWNNGCAVKRQHLAVSIFVQSFSELFW